MLQRIAGLLRHLPPLTVNRGLLYGSGPAVPTDADDGWQTGATFAHTDGGSGTALYVNEGSVTSCNFNTFVTAGYASPLTITPTTTGTFLDFELETEWTGGTLIRADFGSATVFASSAIGMSLDLGANATATHEQDVTGILLTLPASTNSAASPDLKGLQVAVTGAMTTAVSGAATYRGVQIATPAITQTAGTVITHGVHVTGGTITSGTAVGIELAGAWTTGLIINTCTGSAITCIDPITISPNAAGTLLDFVLETEWVSGTLIRADFSGSTTYSAAVVGLSLDLGTNIVATSEQDVTGISVVLPASTNTAASPDLKGVVVSGGAITAATSGDPTFMGVQITTPAINCTLDSIVCSGLDITTGAITQTGGTATSNGIAITGGTINSGSAYGVNLDGAWTAAVNISGTVVTGVAIGNVTGSAITCNDPVTISPRSSGTYLSFALETEWVSGSMIDADFGGGTTFTGAVVGVDLDFGTNIVATSEQSVTGYKITLPQSTNTAASPTLNGLEVAVSGAMTTDTSGTATFNGVKIATPAITQTAGTCTSNGILITGGAITSGTATGINLAGVFDSGIEVADCVQLLQLPASGTAPVEAGGTIGTHGTASLKIRIEINNVEYFLIASTVPTFS